MELHLCPDMFVGSVCCPGGFQWRRGHQMDRRLHCWHVPLYLIDSYGTYNTIQYKYIIPYDTIRYKAIQYKAKRYDTIQLYTIRYKTIRVDTIRHDTIRYNTINAIRFNTIENNELCCCTLYQIKSDSNQCNTIQFNEAKYSTTKCTNTTLTYTAVQFIISYNNKRIIRHDTTPTRTAPHHPTTPHTPSHTPPHYTT